MTSLSTPNKESLEEKTQDVSSIDTHTSPKHVKVDLDTEKSVPADKELQPVSFFTLFRFATRLEIFLDIIGIFCAVLSGAAQVNSKHRCSGALPSYLSIPLASYVSLIWQAYRFVSIFYSSICFGTT